MAAELEYSEKRNSERLATRLQVDFKRIGPEEVESLFKDQAYKDLSKPEEGRKRGIKDAVAAFTQNISVGGLMLLGDSAFQDGEALALAVQLPGLPVPIHTLAMVVWSGSSEGEPGRFVAGLRFLAINKEDIAKIDRYVLLQLRAEREKRSSR